MHYVCRYGMYCYPPERSFTDEDYASGVARLVKLVTPAQPAATVERITGELWEYGLTDPFFAPFDLWYLSLTPCYCPEPSVHEGANLTHETMWL